MKVSDARALELPEGGPGLIEIRLEVRDGVAGWIVKSQEIVRLEDQLTLHGVIEWAGLSPRGNVRLDRAVANQTRLLRHLQQHCPALMVAGQTCEHLEGNEPS